MGAMERNFVVGELYFQSVMDNVVAKSGGGQANATQLLPREVIRITTATAAVAPFDSVMLPPARVGATLMVINHAANSVQMFGQPGDIINDQASATGVTQMANSVVLYSATTDGVWYTESLAQGFIGSFQTVSYQPSLTAHAGGGQGAATPITSMNAFFSVVGTIGDSAVLPNAKPGMEITVINQTATSMNVFPASGETINGAAANTAVAVVGGASGSVTIFYCAVAGAWWTK